MAITTDTGAKKIAGSDNWRDIFDDHNETVDAYDANIAGITDGLAIMANGNTHAAIAAGQAVYVRNHSTLAAGLYWANTTIATNATLSTSNLTADASGGLNKLKGDIDSLNSKFTIEPIESDNILINGGERSQVTIPVSKSGYTPVGILAVYTTQTQVMTITSFYVSRSNAIVGLYNNFSETRDGKMIVRILYMKT